MRKLRIALIGGGIGGLAAALALVKRGFAPRVYEQSGELAEIGAGIQVTPNSAKVFRALGLEDELKAWAFAPQTMVTRDSITGVESSRIPVKDANEMQFGAGWYQLHRADVLDIFVRALPPGIVETGRRVVTLTPGARAATLTFADGREEEADVVVGCDGIHSLVRTTLLGPDKPRFTGHMCWRALVPVDRLPPRHVAPDLSIWMGKRGHIISYYVRRGELVNMVAFRETKTWEEESWSVTSDPRDMLAAFPGVHPDLRLLLERVQSCYRWGVFDRDPLPRWTAGCVTLLGDAAHPMLPFLAQGAAMAIEDGYVLARELARHDDPWAALAAYEAERRPRTAQVQLTARIQGGIYNLHSPLARLKRALGLDPLGDRRADMLKKDWIFGYDPTREPAETAA
jgi:salicylate hydroxylase